MNGSLLCFRCTGTTFAVPIFSVSGRGIANRLSLVSFLCFRLRVVFFIDDKRIDAVFYKGIGGACLTSTEVELRKVYVINVFLVISLRESCINFELG